MEMNGQLHVPAALPPGKQSLVPNVYEIWWASEPVWMLWRREKVIAPAGNRTPTIQPVGSFSLYRLRYRGFMVNDKKKTGWREKGKNRSRKKGKQNKYANWKKSREEKK
jgi:hypothetical protein